MLERLYAVRYGSGFKYGGAAFAFFYYIAKVEGRWVLIDTGFSAPDLAKNMGITLLPVEKEVLEIVLPKQVSEILITHSHWDHMDDLYKYVKARIHLSQKTFDKAMVENCESTRSCLQHGKDTNRICIMESGERVLNTFTYEEIGGHAEDSGVFFFEQGDSKYCVTGDECFSIDCFYNHIAIDNAYDKEKNVLFMDRCSRAGIIPLPSHDDAIMLRYRKVSEHIVQIV